MIEPVTPEIFQRPAQLAFGGEMALPSKTALLRAVAPAMNRLACLSTVPGVVATEGHTVNTAKATIRAMDTLALVTAVRNTGDNSANIYEAGVIVAVVEAGQEKILPERGQMKLEAKTMEDSTYLVVTTHRRSACGDIPSFIATDTEPIGSFLL